MQSFIFEDFKAIQSLLDALPIAVFVKDVQSKFLFMNKACETQWGMRFSDLKNTDASLYFPADQMKIFLEKDQEVFAGGCEIQYEEIFWNATLKQNRYGHTFKKPIYDEMGNPQCLICITIDITENKKITQELSLNEEKLRTLFELSPLGIARNTMDGKFIEANNAFLKILGYSLDELNSLSYWDVTPKQYAPQEAQQLESLKINSAYGPYEKHYINSRGEQIPVRLNGVQITGSHNEKYIWSIVEDISGRIKTEENLRIAAIAFESQEGMFVTNAEGNILRVNQAFTEITGYLADEVIGINPRILRSNRHNSDFFLKIWQTIAKTGSWKGEIWNRHKNGTDIPQHLTITAVKDINGVLTNYVATLTDISQSKAAAEKIEQLAFYDPLTHLPNRRLLFDRLKQAVATCERNGRKGAILFLDLDHFKTLNDTLGHDIGDVLLQQVAQRLTACVRLNDTVARMGGDEFVVVLEELSEHEFEAAEKAETIANKILHELNQPFNLNNHIHHNTPSIGITLFSNHEQGVEDILKQADIAMYQAKRAGRNVMRFFDPEMQENINYRVEMERALREAVDTQQFQLYYQSQVNETGRVVGAEVLIRWKHPLRGLISPLDFIPMAEETGLILPLGNWILNTACQQLAIWQCNESTQHLSISVNVSARQFHQLDFVQQVQNAILSHAVDPKLLKLEITESMLLENVDRIIDTMNALRTLGVQFSLDDFGTGYSSLQYLKKLPLDQLKIDRSFIRDICFESNDQAIVQTIIVMAASLKLAVIAEGVETEEQKLRLLEGGCTNFQGYLFSRPVVIEEFETVLTSD